MDILADLAGMQKRRGLPCVRSRIQSEHPDLLEAFDTALASHFSARSIAEWFTGHGVDTGQNAIQKHRLGICESCRTS